MGILEIVFGSLDLMNMLRIMIFLAAGVLLGIIQSAYMTPPTRVMYVRERDGRGEELKVSNETPISLETGGKTPYRFFKFGRSYEFKKALGKKVSTFFGKEGTAYSWTLMGYSPKRFKDVEEPEDYLDPVTNEIKTRMVKSRVAVDEEGEGSSLVDKIFDTVESLIITLWGEKFYLTVPEEQKKQLRENKVVMTVDLEPGLTPKDYQPITEEDINEEGNQYMAQLLASAAKASLSPGVLNTVALMGFGGLVTAVAFMLMGWVPVGA